MKIKFFVMVLFVIFFCGCSALKLNLKPIIGNCEESVMSNGIFIEEAMRLANFELINKHSDRKKEIKQILIEIKLILDDDKITFDDFSIRLNSLLTEKYENVSKFIFICDILLNPQVEISIPECDKEYIVEIINKLILDIDNLS